MSKNILPISFDLISDLHIDESGELDWLDQPTSPFCVVAGDVARDRKLVKKTLAHLAEAYHQVFYIDGNEEHRNYLDNLAASYNHMHDMVDSIANVVYLRNNMVVLNNTIIVAVNGWWTFDFDLGTAVDTAITWFCNYTSCTRKSAIKIVEEAHSDSVYLTNSIKRLQTHNDISTIVVVSHTMPNSWLVSHDIELSTSPRFNCLGNNMLDNSLSYDREGKVQVWCTGHYHHSIARTLNGVEYISNPRGRKGSAWFSDPYYPKKISFES